MAAQVIPVNGVRGSLGRQPRDPFTVDKKAVLEALNAQWGVVYRVGYADSRWRASRKDGTGEPLSGRTPDDLAAAIRADWSVW